MRALGLVALIVGTSRGVAFRAAFLGQSRTASSSRLHARAIICGPSDRRTVLTQSLSLLQLAIPTSALAIGGFGGGDDGPYGTLPTRDPTVNVE